MIAKVMIVTAMVSLLLEIITTGAANEPPKRNGARDAKARAELDAHLAKIPRADKGLVLPMSDKLVIQEFPEHRFFTVRFREYPIKPPESLTANNLFLVTTDGDASDQKVRHLDIKHLKEFFTRKLGKVLDDRRAKEALKAWLTLAQEFSQDGHLQFAIPDNSLKVATNNGNRVATGKAVVEKGGKGEVEATMIFGAKGELIDVTTIAQVRPEGARPA